MLRLIFRVFFRSASPKRKIRPPSTNIVTPDFQRRVLKRQTQSSASPQRPVTNPRTQPSPQLETTLTGKCYVVDGDTIRIGKVSLRLAGIDAPELEHPWGQKAKWELVRLCKGQVITAEIEPEISYDRVVATCFLPDGRDLSAEMVRRGLALDWPKFSGGKYSHLEPDDARKKHWKAAARQRGHMHVFNK
ncbi:thermonuclease family protein [Aliiroseovarius sp. YM-037]